MQCKVSRLHFQTVLSASDRYKLLQFHSPKEKCGQSRGQVKWLQLRWGLSGSCWLKLSMKTATPLHLNVNHINIIMITIIIIFFMIQCILTVFLMLWTWGFNSFWSQPQPTTGGLIFQPWTLLLRSSIQNYKLILYISHLIWWFFTSFHVIIIIMIIIQYK